MALLYLTQDTIGTQTGGGIVTRYEYEALSSLNKNIHPIDRARLPVASDPFADDTQFANLVTSAGPVELAHIYAGCFTKTVEYLKSTGAKVTFTCAAHNIADSKREFEELGYGFNLPHLTEPKLWEQYNGGYRNANLVICPSTYSAKIVRSYGCGNVRVIPHGTHIPDSVAPLPKRFTVGYLGQTGPDKGLRYLFTAWKLLNFKDSTLVIGGAQFSNALNLWRRFGGGNVHFTGFVNSPSDLYNQCSTYVQPSATEGFGIEVLEAMSHGRSVIVSEGAGAADVVREDLNGYLFPARDINKLCDIIQKLKDNYDLCVALGSAAREHSKQYTWDIVKRQYTDLWKNLLGMK